MRELMAMLPGHGVAPLIFIGCLILLLSLLRAASGPPPPVAKPFLTRREAAMLRALEQVLPMYRIHAHVVMGALLKAPAEETIMELNSCDGMIELRRVRSGLTRMDVSIVLEVDMGYQPGSAAPAAIWRRRSKFAALADVALAVFVLFLTASLAMAIEIGVFDSPAEPTCVASTHKISASDLGWRGALPNLSGIRDLLRGPIHECEGPALCLDQPLA